MMFILFIFSNLGALYLLIFSERGMPYSSMVRVLMISAEENHISLWDAFETVLTRYLSSFHLAL